MKKLCAMILTFLLLISSFSVFPASAAVSDFDVRNGVLVKYNGSDKNVTLPDTVYAIGASAFEGNTKINTITLSAKVYSIGEQAFYGCSALSTVNGGANVSEVGDLAFHKTPYLERSTDKYFMLGSVLLWYNGTADSVSIPTRCTAVASYAFMRCDYLKSFTAYEGLISVGTGAFYGCSKLSTVNLPSTVSSVGAYAFDGTPYLSSFDEFAVAGDGVLMKYNGTDTEVTIPDKVKRIAPHAFVSSKMTKVSIPQCVYSVDSYAFADCVNLSEVKFSDGLVNIGDGAFRGCKALRNVKTPVTLSYIGQSSFSGCTSLQGAAVRGDDVTVSYNAFKGCNSLAYVLLSDGVSAVFDNAFDSCKSLEGVSFSSKTTEIAATALSGSNKAVVCCEENSAAQKIFSDRSVNTMIGDVDSNRSLNIMDATLIQFFIAYLTTFNGTQTASADFNFDGEINIYDAYLVQTKAAGLI